MLQEEEIVERMARAFQEATLKPLTWVDAKRGVEAALQALLESLPEIPNTVFVVNDDNVTEINNYEAAWQKLLSMRDK